MIRCSEKPILTNDLLRFNRILTEIIGHINNNPYTKEYDYDYHNFTVVKYHYALDGTLPYRLKKGSLIKDSPYRSQEYRWTRYHPLCKEKLQIF